MLTAPFCQQHGLPFIPLRILDTQVFCLYFLEETYKFIVLIIFTPMHGTKRIDIYAIVYVVDIINHVLKSTEINFSIVWIKLHFIARVPSLFLSQT